VIALVGADRRPVAEGERAVVAAADGAHGAIVLLARVDPVREAVVRGEVVHLARRLVVPAAPVRAAVHGHDGALVGSRDHVVGMLRVDPHIVIVVAARGALADLARRPAGGPAGIGAALGVALVGFASLGGRTGEIPVEQFSPAV